MKDGGKNVVAAVRILLQTLRGARPDCAAHGLSNLIYTDMLKEETTTTTAQQIRIEWLLPKRMAVTDWHLCASLLHPMAKETVDGVSS